MIGRDSETLRELKSDDVRLELPARAHLFLVLECDRPEAGGARYSLHGADQVHLGRGESRQARRTEDGILYIEVRDRWMSSPHARLTREQGGWVFEDSESTNGSSVDSAPVTRCPLRDGAVLTIGHTIFVFRESVRTPLEAQTDVDFSDLDSSRVAFASLLPEYGRDLSILERLAKSELSILLLGETGTGKEVLARAIHATSGRAGPLVAVNCGAVPESLIESQFFGHERGAFSGAHREAPGFVRASDKGTLFLDEIGDLRGSSQAVLLRVLQEREVTPVGSVRTHKVDIRVVSATHQPIDALVASAAFRTDLLARLSGARHRVPALRERREDLGLIYAAIVRETIQSGKPTVRLTPESARAFLAYGWPGNIRELRQVIAASAVLSEDEWVRFGSLPPSLRENRPVATDERRTVFTEASQQSLRDRLIAHLAAHSGNITAVAEAMQTSRTQVYRWLKRFAIDVAQFGRTRE